MSAKMKLDHVTGVTDAGDFYWVEHKLHGRFKLPKERLAPETDEAVRAMCRGGQAKGYANASVSHQPDDDAPALPTRIAMNTTPEELALGDEAGHVPGERNARKDAERLRKEEDDAPESAPEGPTQSLPQPLASFPPPVGDSTSSGPPDGPPADALPPPDGELPIDEVAAHDDAIRQVYGPATDFPPEEEKIEPLPAHIRTFGADAPAPGIAVAGQPLAPVDAPPSAAASPAASVAPAPPSAEDQVKQASAQEQAAAIAQGKALAEQSKQRAVVEQQGRDLLEARYRDQAQRSKENADIQNEFVNRMRPKNPDGTPNPNYDPIRPYAFFHDASLGSKIAGIAGLVLGGIGSGFAGQPNAALELFDKMAEKDVAAQISNRTGAFSKLIEQGHSINDAALTTLAAIKDYQAASLLAASDGAQSAVEKARAESAASKLLTDSQALKQQVSSAANKNHFEPLLLQNAANAGALDVGLKATQLRGAETNQAITQQALDGLRGGDTGGSVLERAALASIIANPEERSKHLVTVQIPKRNAKGEIVEDPRTGGIAYTYTPLIARSPPQKVTLDNDLPVITQQQADVHELQKFVRQHGLGTWIPGDVQHFNDLRTSLLQTYPKETLDAARAPAVEEGRRIATLIPSIGLYDTITGKTATALDDFERELNLKRDTLIRNNTYQTGFGR